ncbi:hypothetical protein FOZ62_023897, partial [Perkinsus olseni]
CPLARSRRHGSSSTAFKLCSTSGMGLVPHLDQLRSAITVRDSIRCPCKCSSDPV